jgi:hypothetical protein
MVSAQNHPAERELKSTLMRLAHLLHISYDETKALLQATRMAVAKLPCPLLAAWVLDRVVRRRFGDMAATAVATGALIYSCGRVDYDTLISCATRNCDGVTTETARKIMETAYDVGTMIGLVSEEVWYVAGLLKYYYVNFRVTEPQLKGAGTLWGELVAYALRIQDTLPQ